MTNYITPVGIQQFSIVIPSGSTTATTSINAVGSGAFILWGGTETTSAQANSAFAYLSLTNATTITATRNASSGTIDGIAGCIIDGDPSTFIKSVQRGTVTIASSALTGTATITTVNNSNTAVHLLGWASADTSYSDSADNPVISLSGTTVTATRTNAFPAALVVGYQIIEFQSAALNQSVQQISASSSAATTSYSATINSVNTNNTIIFYAGCNIANVTSSLAASQLYATLSNSTTLTVNAIASSANAKTYNCSVVEFATGVLTANVQRGTTALTGVTSNTSTISSTIVRSSLLSWLNNSTTATNSLPQAKGVGGITSSTMVSVARENSSNSILGSWEVAQFNAATAIYSTGTATGTATALGSSGSAATSTGIAIVSGVSNAGSVGNAVGSALVAGTAKINIPSVGSATGTATVNGMGGVSIPSSGAAIGAAAVSGVGKINAFSSGSAIGIATVNAQGNLIPGATYPLPPIEEVINIIDPPLEFPIPT